MAYSELIKSFNRIRDYMRDFYVYGFKRREEYDIKSPRSYDNERRRIESLLGEHMSFRQDSAGKQVFISIDSRNIINNPLYNAFKAKSFTSRDIMLHFFLLDILCRGQEFTARELSDKLSDEYFSFFDSQPSIDESTLRNKLKEYEILGLVVSEKSGRQLNYRICSDNVPLQEWSDAISFFSEEDLLGVIGSYLLDKISIAPQYFRFKHHYILHALESEILFELLEAIYEQKKIRIDIYNSRRGRPSAQTVTPLKIYVSTQGGRLYLMAHAHFSGRISIYRIDSIKAVKLLDKDCSYEAHLRHAKRTQGYLWGVSSGMTREPEHIEMTIFAGPDEWYIVSRLEREKRSGTVESLGNGLYCFTADVYDTVELLPWIRTFIGRIRELKCSNQRVLDTFIQDFKEIEAIYLGGGADVIS